MERLADQRQATGLDAREVENVLDQLQEVFGTAEAARHEVTDLVADARHVDQLEHAHDGRERCPELMAHDGQELALGDAGGFRGLLGSENLADLAPDDEQHGALLVGADRRRHFSPEVRSVEAPEHPLEAAIAGLQDFADLFGRGLRRWPSVGLDRGRHLVGSPPDDLFAAAAQDPHRRMIAGEGASVGGIEDQVGVGRIVEQVTEVSLALLQRHFGLLAGRDVGHGAQQPHRIAVRIALEDSPVVVHPDVVAIGMAHPVVHRIVHVPADGVVEGGLHPLLIVGMNAVEEI